MEQNYKIKIYMFKKKNHNIYIKCNIRIVITSNNIFLYLL